MNALAKIERAAHSMHTRRLDMLRANAPGAQEAALHLVAHILGDSRFTAESLRYVSDAVLRTTYTLPGAADLMHVAAALMMASRRRGLDLPPLGDAP